MSLVVITNIVNCTEHKFMVTVIAICNISLNSDM